MMTRKDYTKVAAILALVFDDEVRMSLAVRFAAMFAEDNPRFLPGRFFVACEVEVEHANKRLAVLQRTLAAAGGAG